MANPNESALSYPFADTLPEPGTAMEVAPGVKWLRMALPFVLDHINLWLLEDGDGWTVVDCGIANDTTRESWERVFANELGGKPVRRVLVTHMHPDHIGLAHWLTERWSTPDGSGSAPPIGTRCAPPSPPVSASTARRRHVSSPATASPTTRC